MSRWLLGPIGTSLAACIQLAGFPAQDAVVDTTTPDATTPDATTPDTTTLDTTVATETETSQTPSEQIAAVRSAPNGPTALRIDDARVTYVRTRGFFVQAELDGPAVFVDVPSEVEVGDRVAFTVTSVRTVASRREVDGIDSLVVRDHSDVDDLVRDVSSATDLTDDVVSYESELVTLRATIVGPWSEVGSPISTEGLASDPHLVLRVPLSVRTALGLAQGCVVQVTGPMWRVDDEAQPIAEHLADVEVVSCPEGPRLELRELAVNIRYPPNNTRCQLVELAVTRGGDITGFELHGDDSFYVRFGSPRLAMVETGDIIVVHLNPSGIACRGVDGAGDPIPGAFNELAVDEIQSSTFYPNAFDLWASGVTATMTTQSVALTVHDPSGAIIDAAAFWRAGQNVLSSSVEAIESARLSGQWFDPGQPYDEASYAEHAASGLDLANDQPTSPTVQRVGATDTDSSADWAVAPETFGE